MSTIGTDRRVIAKVESIMSDCDGNPAFVYEVKENAPPTPAPGMST